MLGVGRKEGLDPLNSEEADLLQALAGQAATAFMNGRLYQSLREKADELQQLTEYNENILESMDSGILVLDLEERVARWNRALEKLYGVPPPPGAGPPPRRRLPGPLPGGAARQPGAGPAGGGRDRPPLQAAPGDGRRPQPDGERGRRPLPAPLGRARRHAC